VCYLFYIRFHLILCGSEFRGRNSVLGGNNVTPRYFISLFYYYFGIGSRFTTILVADRDIGVMGHTATSIAVSFYYVGDSSPIRDGVVRGSLLHYIFGLRHRLWDT